MNSLLLPMLWSIQKIIYSYADIDHNDIHLSLSIISRLAYPGGIHNKIWILIIGNNNDAIWLHANYQRVSVFRGSHVPETLSFFQKHSVQFHVTRRFKPASSYVFKRQRSPMNIISFAPVSFLPPTKLASNSLKANPNLNTSNVIKNADELACFQI